MKTVYSRFGNVKAGKFAANADELSSDDYNEDAYENLNDIETVLDSIGIKLRANATTFRSVDDVLDEVGTKWKTYNNVTQNAIGTAVAGTRQRENVIALFDNWDKVQKYAKIAENSYGTATKKMEAYNDSLEASQNRVTAAVEDLSLNVNGSKALIMINNGIAGLIDNVEALTVSLLALGVAFNMKGITDIGVKGLSALGIKVTEITSLFNNFKQTVSDGTFFEHIGNNINEAYDIQQTGKYKEKLLEYTGKNKIEGDELSALISLQNKGMEAPNSYQKTMGEFLTSNKFDVDFFSDAMKDKANVLIANKLKTAELTDKTTEEITQMVALIREKQEVIGITEQQKIAITRAIEAEDIRTNALTQDTIELQRTNPESAAIVGGNLQERSGRGSGIYQSLMGFSSLAGMISGGVGGSGLVERLGGGSGSQMAGSIVGSVVGASLIPKMSKIGSEVVKPLLSAFTGAGAKGIAAFGSGLLTNAVPLIGIGAIVAGLFFKGYKAIQEKKIKEAREDFQEAAEKYNKALNASADVSQYKELVKGVDSLGNNVSLTDDEYKDFLDTSNELAQAFPSLITRTDDAGNSFVGMGGKVGDVTDEVNKLTKAMQIQADQTLLNKDSLEDTLKTAKKEYNEAQDKKNKVDNTMSFYKEYGYINGAGDYDEEEKSILGRYGKVTNVIGNDGTSHIGYNIPKDKIASLEGELKQLSSTYEQEMNEATQSVSDEMKAQVRTALGDSFYDLSDEEVQAINTIASSITPDIDGWEEKVSDIATKTKDFFAENPVYLEFLYGDNSSKSASEVSAMYQEILTNLSKYFKVDTSEALKILVGLGWDESGLNENDSLGKIQSEKLFSKVKGDNGQSLSSTDFTNAFGKDFNTEQMSVGYSLLSGSVDDATFSIEQFKNAVYEGSIGSMGLTQLVKAYEDFEAAKENNGSLSDNEKKQWDIVKQSLNSYAKELGLLPEEYDKIIAKAKVMGDLTSIGTSTLSPQQAQDKIADYGKIYQYLKNDYNGTWDEDQSTLVSKYSELLPYIGNPKEMEAKLKETLDNGGDLYKETIQGKLTASEEGSKAILDNASDEVAEFKKKYGIDLTNFATIDMAKQALDSLAQAQLTGNWETWVTTMDGYYNKDLINFTTKAARKQALNAMIASGMDLEDGQLSNFQRQASDLGLKGEDASNYVSKKLMSYQKEKTTQDFKKSLEEVTSMVNALPIGKYDAGSGSSKKNTSSDKDTVLDIANAKLNLIDKEYEAQQAMSRAKTFEDGKNTLYYKKEREALLEKKDALATMIAQGGKASEILGYYKDIQDVEVSLNKLEQERLSDLESWAGEKHTSHERNKEILTAEIKNAKTYEDKLAAQKKLRDEKKSEEEDYLTLLQNELDSNKRLQSYLNPDSAEFDTYTNKMVKNYQDMAKASEDYLNNVLMVQYINDHMTEINPATGKNYTYSESYAWAKQQPEILEMQKNITENFDNAVQTVLDATTTKVQKVQDALDTLNKFKPEEWINISDINNYTEQTIAGLAKQIGMYQDTLNSGLDLTNEQITDLTSKINDNIKAIHDAQIQQQQDTVDLKSKTYDAFTWQINEYIDKLSIYKEKVDKAYDEEIKKLQDVNESKERTIKLTELLQNLENAQNEKQRTYVEGVGWVYRNNRSSVKKAQKDLNDFYSQDRITDLQNTKDAEDKILDQRTENWNDYLKSVEKAYNEYENETKEHLLFEQFNVDSQEELFNTLHDDMTLNVERLKTDFTDYTGVMDDFISDYTTALDKLTKLKQEWVNQMNLDLNGTITGATGTTTTNAQGQTVTAGSTGVLNTGVYNGTGSASAAYDKLTGVDYARNQSLANSVVQQGRYQVYYDELGYVTKAVKTSDSAGYTVNGVTYNGNGKKVDSYGNVIVDKNASNSSSKGLHYDDNSYYGTDKDDISSTPSGKGTGNGPSASDIYNNTPGWDLVGFADGIERGAATFTGLTMLHGTPSKPEYVLNNDQMYNFVRNMSTKTPEFSSNIGSSSQTPSYNFYGDIDLPNVQDPSNFMSELMSATDNRINVTKNKKL